MCSWRARARARAPGAPGACPGPRPPRSARGRASLTLSLSRPHPAPRMRNRGTRRARLGSRPVSPSPDRPRTRGRAGVRNHESRFILRFHSVCSYAHPHTCTCGPTIHTPHASCRRGALRVASSVALLVVSCAYLHPGTRLGLACREPQHTSCLPRTYASSPPPATRSSPALRKVSAMCVDSSGKMSTSHAPWKAPISA